MERSSRLIQSAIELLCVFLVILDLLFFKTCVVTGASVAYFVFDFVRYRREAVLNYRASKSLREKMTLRDIRSIERKYSLRDDFDSFEKHAQARTPLDRYFYFAKYERVRDLIVSYGPKEGLWLDMGCGFGEDTYYISQRLSRKVIGLELDEIKLFQARRHFQKLDSSTPLKFLAADALHPPFAAGTFDAILVTEVLEHWVNPEGGVPVCHTLLKEGGVLVGSTQSSHNLGYRLNPLWILEKSLSLLDDRILPPYHALHARFEYDRKKPEPEYGIHYHFSQKQLRRILVQNGFHLLWEGSFEIELFPFLYVEFFSNGDADRIRRIVRPIESLLERIPFINRLGQHLLFVAQKLSA